MFPHTLPQAAGADHPEYTLEECHAWQWLCLRLKEGSNFCDDRQSAQLRFLRWLVVTSQLIEGGQPTATANGGRVADQ
jgi:hypothetical protein